MVRKYCTTVQCNNTCPRINYVQLNTSDKISGETEPIMMDFLQFNKHETLDMLHSLNISKYK